MRGRSASLSSQHKLEKEIDHRRTTRRTVRVPLSYWPRADKTGAPDTWEEAAGATGENRSPGTFDKTFLHRIEETKTLKEP